jgi:hypothetical protein
MDANLSFCAICAQKHYIGSGSDTTDISGGASQVEMPLQIANQAMFQVTQRGSSDQISKKTCNSMHSVLYLAAPLLHLNIHCLIFVEHLIGLILIEQDPPFEKYKKSAKREIREIREFREIRA